mgnify:FL=1
MKKDVSPQKKVWGNNKMDFSSIFAQPTLQKFGTFQLTDNIFDMTGAESLVYLALRKVTYANKRFLILTGAVKDMLLSALKNYKSFKPIQKLIKRISKHGIISILPYKKHDIIIFNEGDGSKTDPILDSQGFKMDPPILSKRVKEDSNNSVPTVPDKINHKSSFILSDQHEQNKIDKKERMNESPDNIKTKTPDIKNLVDKQYIKTMEQLPEFKKYSQEDQATIHKFIHKAKTKNIDPTIIDDYCRSIIFNKTPSNMKNPKYKPILNIKNYSYAALFNNMSIYHKMDNPNFPFDTRTQDELKHEQRQKETIEKQTLEQQTSKAIENTQENFLTKLKYLQDLFKENFEALLTKAKLAVARIKNYNPLFVPEIDAVEELYNNHSIYDSTAIAV